MKFNNQTALVGALVLCLSTMAMAQEAITVTVDGNNVVFTDVQPIMRAGRVFVPIRGVFEYMKADVKWDNVNRSVVAKRGEDTITIPLGGNKAILNGQEVVLNDIPFMERGRVLVPLRFLSESLSAKVVWLESRRLVQIDTTGPGAVPQTKPEKLALWLL